MPDTPVPETVPPSTPARTPRQQVLLGAEISASSGVPTKHRIKNLSTTGARIDRAGKLKPGATILVTVGVLDAVEASVVWVKDDVAGLAFAEPIDPDAARGKSIVHGQPAASPKTATLPLEGSGPRATAGWVGDLSNPYRKPR